MDSNWRWTHKPDEPTNCYTGNEWDQELCPDAATCTENCALDGIDQTTWEGTYGVKIDGSDMTLSFVTEGPYSRNVGSNISFRRIWPIIRKIHVVEPRIH